MKNKYNLTGKDVIWFAKQLRKAQEDRKPELVEFYSQVLVSAIKDVYGK